MSKYCQYCGSLVDDSAKFCTNCGSNLVETPAQEATYEAPAPAAQPVSQPTYEPLSTGGGVPGWKTSVGMSILGIVASIALNSVVNSFNNGDSSGVGGLISLAYLVCCIVYALAFYPKYFDGRRIDNSGMTSFLNCFFGGIIFGLIWNSNLTKNHKGISHIVYALFVPCVIIILLVLVFVFGLLAVGVSM